MKRVAIAALVCAVGISAAEAALTKEFYAKESVLSSGKWVKIGVGETGVYEISYRTLTEMGFSNPSKVSVYGRGGRVLPESFTNSSGHAILTDDLAPVKVMHSDDKLYFYGLGPEEIDFVSSDDYSTGGYFTRKGNNIYSFRGYYFLTDSKPVVEMEEKSSDTTAERTVTKGVSFVYHELDSLQNDTKSGQLFWGETVGLPFNPKRTWTASMPDAIPGDGVMECILYFKGNGFGNADISFGFEGADHFTTPYVQPSTVSYLPHMPGVGAIEIPGKEGKVFVEFTGNDMGDFSNLDYWVISYSRNLPTLKGVNGESLNQQFFALPDIKRNESATMQLPYNAGLVVLDVTSENNPVVLKVKQTGPNGNVMVTNSGLTPELVVFDKTLPQKQICGYEMAYNSIVNQNLHSYQNEGADFIIICTPQFRDYAEQIADLHRKYDGIKVAVATTEECYNEFSAGVPDPMAYRSFAKMLYMSDTKPKNMLLLGPLYGDFRGIQSEHNPMEGIIAYQSPLVSVSRGAHNINDFYGMMSDIFRTDYYERNEVQIGVAILPVKSVTQAAIVVDKIRKYLERDDHAYFLNKYTAIGGLGDEHIHDTQIRDIDNHIRKMDNLGTVFTPLAIDTYGNKEAQKKFFNQLNDGCNLFSYFGHGAEQFLGKNGDFFNAGDVLKLHNKVLPFALFGGCMITNTDRGFRGLGETIVTDTEHGAIGAIVSARDTWSGQNLEFFKQFFIYYYNKGEEVTSPHRTDPATIGEVYASVKNTSLYSNELAYQLLCDPALVIPVINNSINYTAASDLKPGEKLKLSGQIITPAGEIDNAFNGQVVVRLNEPARNVAAGCIETGENPKTLSYTYRDEQVAMTAGDVKNGKFDIEIAVPSSLATFNGEKALIYLCAYDPMTRKGAGSGYEITVANTNVASSSEKKDTTPPVVENLSFDEKECTISFTVSDNYALNLSGNPLHKGLYLYIDGKERSEAHFVEPVIESGRAALSKTFYVNNLAYGEHAARLKVKDAAGNSAESEIVFTYSPAKAKYTIQRSEKSNSQATTIEIAGETPAEGQVIILSASGTEIWRGNLSGSSIEWNHTDLSGNKVQPGHYKAYLIETGNGTQKGHSETIDVPVV